MLFWLYVTKKSKLSLKARVLFNEMNFYALVMDVVANQNVAVQNWWHFSVRPSLASSPRCFLRHFNVSWIVQESPLHHSVEGSLLHQNPLSVKIRITGKKFMFPLCYLIHFSHSFFEFSKFHQKKTVNQRK